MGLDSMTGGEILWLSEKQGKEKEMRRDGGLSTARHVCVPVRNIRLNCLRKCSGRKGQVSCLVGMYSPPSNC